jgi:FtsZ-binding cell division protein ZapB
MRNNKVTEELHQDALNTIVELKRENDQLKKENASLRSDALELAENIKEIHQRTTFRHSDNAIAKLYNEFLAKYGEK